MKTFLKLVVSLLLLSNVLTGQNDTNNWGRKSYYNRMYNEKTLVQVTGTITSIEQVVPKKGSSAGIHFILKTEAETFAVHLGPKWHLDKQSIQLKIGDEVAVKGSKVTVDSKATIIAKDVIRDGVILILRDETGRPVWSGKRDK